MRKTLLIILTGLLISPFSAYAGIYGILKGKVVDSEGKPVIGASIFVEGTTRGTYVKDKDGSFTIVNINTGRYNIRVRAVGYAEQRVQISISADQTTDINVVLQPEAVMMGEVIKYADREMVSKTDQGTIRKITNQDVTQIAREGVQGVIGLSAGVFNAGAGFNIRGSRETETQIRVDGLDIGNQFSGGTGSGGLTYTPMVSQYVVEEAQVITGNFAPEYGNALGGIVNTTVKTGRTDKYEGFLRYRTGVEALWGSQRSGIHIKKEGEQYKLVESGPGKKALSEVDDDIEFGVSGPLPILENSTFLISGSYFHEKYRSASYEIYDPIGNNIGKRPDNGTWVKNLIGRIRFSITNDISLIVGSMYGITSWENSSWGWLYANDFGLILDTLSDGSITKSYNNIPERIAKQGVGNTFITNFYGRVNHTLDNKTFYEITVSNTSNNDEFTRRLNGDPPDFFTGFKFLEPKDNYTIDYGVKLGADKVVDWYQPIRVTQKTSDGYFQKDNQVINPLTGYIEGGDNYTGSNNAYGLDNFFVTHGNDPFQIRHGNYWQVDGSITHILDGEEFHHNIKSGFEFRYFSLKRHYNGNPWTAEPFYDVYSDEWGGNIYAETPEVKQRTSQGFNPWSFALHANDQLSYKGLLLSLGLRFDYFNPNSKYRLPSRDFQPITADSSFNDSEAKVQLSPRINVTYPVTERSNISISYGIFFKMPEIQNLYDSFNKQTLRGNDIVGNPNMEAQRTNMYEIGYINQFTDDYAFDIKAYYKDIYNQLGIQFVRAVPDPYYTYVVAEYGNAKGIEVTFRKRPSNNYYYELNYNLSSTTGTSTSAGENYGVSTDPFTGKLNFPLTEFPLSFDRRHRINLKFGINWGDMEGPSIGGLRLLENSYINLSGFWQTGTPFTRTDIGGKPISEKNAERHPSVWSADLRISKKFYMRDLFGESAGSTAFEFFVDVTNLFNFNGPVAYYSATGDPDDDGITLQRRIGNFSPVAFYKDPDIAKPLTITNDQYDNFGNRLYNANADFDKNGIVTQEEKFQSYLNYAETAFSFRGNYRYPRTVFVGVMFWF